MKWYEQKDGLSGGVIISTRIRMARNFNQLPFPLRASREQAAEAVKMVSGALTGNGQPADMKFEKMDMTQISYTDRIAMMEMHIISPNFVRKQMPTALMLSEDEAVSVMVNEEDHVRIQSMAVGMNPVKALEKADAVDDLLESTLDYAFDPGLGYLTSCPTNLGTGLRASYMIHVPALETSGQLQLILEAIGKFGLTVRGIYGEGSDALGSVFQISNQISMGLSEKEIIDNLTGVTGQIVEQELMVRNKLMKERRHRIEDAVFRSYGIMRHARMISSKEAMTMLSDLKLGIELGIVSTENKEQINIYNLMSRIQPANLQLMHNHTLSSDERDMARAEYLRRHLPKIAE